MARLPLYYYCTRHELEAMGWDEEPGVPVGTDISDPKLLQKPTVFLKPGEPPRGATNIDTSAIEALLAEADATAAPLPKPTTSTAPDADLADPPALPEATTPAPYTPPPLPDRGWTPERQRQFLAAVAEGFTIETACRSVGLSVQSAYKLRRSATGAAFALGWNAALLIHRNRLADALISRVHDGQQVTWTKADGQETTRHFFDNRLGLAMLTRLDRIAAEQKAEGTDHATRMVAQDFDAYLDTIEQGSAPARAGLFVARRTTLELTEAFDDEEVSVAQAAAAIWSSPQLAPVAALARADLYMRTGASLPQEIATADLDYEKRADWTAEQWQRADAAGLLSPSSPTPFGSSEACPEHGRTERWEEEEATPHNHKLNPPKPPRPTTGTEGRVWFDTQEGEFLTNFAPPEDFDFYQSHPWGHPDYERALTIEEHCLLDQRHADQLRELSAPDCALRDRWFTAVETGETDLFPLYAQQREEPAPAATPDASPDANAEDAAAALLAEFGADDPFGRKVREGFAAADRGDISTVMDVLEECRALRGLPPGAGRALPERPDAPDRPAPSNRKARRTAAARRRTRNKEGDAGAESAHAA